MVTSSTHDKAVAIDSEPAYRVRPGRPHPLGATPDAHGTNFALFSQDATAVQLLLFDDARRARSRSRPSTSTRTSTGRSTSGTSTCTGCRPGMHYAYRVDGPQDLQRQGTASTRTRCCIDPYARGNTNDALGPRRRLRAGRQRRDVACAASSSTLPRLRLGGRPAAQPADERHRHLRDARPRLHAARRPRASSIPGTFLGRHREDPVPAVARRHRGRADAGLRVRRDRGLRDQPARPASRSSTTGATAPIGFFAPHASYCVRPDEGEPASANSATWSRPCTRPASRSSSTSCSTTPARATTRARPISFKGLDNSIYYHLEPDDQQYYTNYSGCGNTVNCNHPIVAEVHRRVPALLGRARCTSTASASTWRSILSRGEDGAPMGDPPVVWHIELDDDAGRHEDHRRGLGRRRPLPGRATSRATAGPSGTAAIRDDVRRFVKGDRGHGRRRSRRASPAAPTSTRPTASCPINSINFITAHDGFTLNDLVSYNEKHNEANGEGNRDGTDDNLSWNCGVEGDTDDPAIEALRSRQVKNFADHPDALAGRADDRHGRRGPPHAARQQQRLLPGQRDHLVRLDAASTSTPTWCGSPASSSRFRKDHPNLRRTTVLHRRAQRARPADISLARRAGSTQPGWDDPESRVLAFTLAGFPEHADDQAATGYPRDDEHGLGGRSTSTSRQLDGRRWHRVHRHRAGARRTTSRRPGQEEPSSRAARTGSATGASWSLSRSQCIGDA